MAKQFYASAMSGSQRERKRMLFIMPAGVVILALIAACGAAGGGPDSSAPGASEPANRAPAEPTPTVDLSAPPPTPEPTPLPQVTCRPDQKQLVWMVRNNAVENKWEVEVVRPAFEKVKPEICLKILSMAQDDIAIKRQAMIAEGEPLHVWSPNWGGDGFASDRARGLLADLSPLIERDKLDTSVFNQDVLKIYQIEGKTWGLPFLTTGSYIYYNKQMFDAAGVPYPPLDWDDSSWTWDRFVETARSLTKNVDNINQAQFGAADDAWPPVDAISALWGYWIMPDEAHRTGFAENVQVVNDKTVAAFQAFHDLRFRHMVAPEQAALDALATLGGAFQSGRVAMYLSGGWGHWNYQPLIDDPSGFCWGAAPLPMGSPDAKRRATIFTDPWVITAQMTPEETDMAWEFVKFLVSPEQAALFSKSTGTPPTQTDLLDDYYQQFSKCMKPEDMKKVFEGAFSHGRESSNHMLVGFGELQKVWDNILPALNNDPSGDVKAFLSEIETQFNDALARIKAEEGR